jgi:hypothetical protein
MLSVVTLRIYNKVSLGILFGLVLESLTLSLIPNASKTSTKAAARFTPVWDFATSTISSRKALGTPPFSKCTVIATYAL